MINKTTGVYVAVISTGRPDNVMPMHTRWLGKPATWYVKDDDEAFAYQAAGATAVKVGGQLCRSRNQALDDAFALGVPCLQLSDDLKHLAQASGKQRSMVTVVTVADVVGLMHQAIDANAPAHMAGCAPTANPFYSDSSVKTKHFIVGDFILVLPTDLRFNEELRLKEDYDYTCQHLRKYGCVARLDYVMADFAHHNPGGASHARGANALQSEETAINLLERTWPNAIRRNPRRPGEVLLKWAG